MPPSSSSGCATVCIRRAVVCRRRNISFSPAEPLSMGSGLVSTQGDGTCAKAAVHRSVSSRHRRAIVSERSFRPAMRLERTIGGQKWVEIHTTHYRVHKLNSQRDARPRRLWDYEELDVRLVYVAPLPLTGLEGLHHRVSSFFEVLGGMPAGRGVATADMSADETLAQL